MTFFNNKMKTIFFLLLSLHYILAKQITTGDIVGSLKNRIIPDITNNNKDNLNSSENVYNHYDQKSAQATNDQDHKLLTRDEDNIVVHILKQNKLSGTGKQICL